MKLQTVLERGEEPKCVAETIFSVENFYFNNRIIFVSCIHSRTFI